MSIIASRLTDPEGLCDKNPRLKKECEDKLSDAMTCLYRLPSAGGNPFLFALSGPKPHELRTSIGGQPLETAATDGKQYYWNPDFLASLDKTEVTTVMSHESYHVVFYHCASERAGGLDAADFNIAVDYAANGVIEHETDLSGRRSFKPVLWTGPIGPAIPFQHYIEWIDGIRPTLPEKGCFADVTVYGRSPESMYDEIRKHKHTSPRRCKEAAGGCGAMSLDPATGKSTIQQPWDPGSCPKCGAKPSDKFGPGSLDSHIAPAQSKDEVMSDMMRAAEQTRAMGRGTVPEEIEAALGRLQKPELTARDIIRSFVAQKKVDAGNVNDWKHIRRRPTFLWTKDEATGAMVPKHRLYIPKKQDFIPKWVALIDTSGSMSDDDIANGVKEMQLVADIAEGWIVPCDATPYWDKATKVTRATDVKRTKIVGRGGTVFTQFFEELPKQKFGAGVDLIVIITDGDCGEIPRKLCPPGADVLWILTSGRDGFKPNFGRVCALKPVRMLARRVPWIPTIHGTRLAETTWKSKKLASRLKKICFTP